MVNLIHNNSYIQIVNILNLNQQGAFINYYKKNSSIPYSLPKSITKSMAKSNPNRQELIQFINQVVSELDHKIFKIQDLSNGVHYLYLLHKVHPDVVKLAKVNVKATHQHQNVVNLKLLASYLASVKANFTVEVQKISQRNYQQNLNLIKNLYKHYHMINSEKKSISVDSRSLLHAGQKINQRRPTLAVVKGPPKPLKAPTQLNKVKPQNDGLKNILKQSKSHAQQIKLIKVIIEEESSEKNKHAQQKLKQIKQILGIQKNNSGNKKSSKKELQNEISARTNTNYSIKCSGSKSNKNQRDFQSQKRQNKQISLKQAHTQNKPTNVFDKQGMDYTANNPKILVQRQKQFDCDQIKKSMLKKYQLRSSSLKKSQKRLTLSNIENWANQENQQNLNDQNDTKYENLLSPYYQKQVSDRKIYPTSENTNSKRKSIIIKSQINNSLDKVRNPQIVQRKANFSGQRSYEKKNEQKLQQPNMISALKKVLAAKIAHQEHQRIQD